MLGSGASCPYLTLARVACTGLDARTSPSFLRLSCVAGAFGTAWYVRHRRYANRGTPSNYYSLATPAPRITAFTLLRIDYALKALEKRQVETDKWRAVVLREKCLLAGLAPHRNIIALYQTFQDEKHLYLLMELAEGGELYKILYKARR